MAKSKLVKANQKIAEGVTEGFHKIEDGVVGSYQKIEGTVVGAYKKVEDAFVDQFLTHEGESVEDAKKRLAEERPPAGRPAKPPASTERPFSPPARAAVWLRGPVIPSEKFFSSPAGVNKTLTFGWYNTAITHRGADRPCPMKKKKASLTCKEQGF